MCIRDSSKRELSIDVVHEQLISTIYEQSVSPVHDTMAEDLSVSCRTRWRKQLSCRWMSDEFWCYEMDVHERGTWQLYHVRRLAFCLNVSFYLMQHTPLWRSKFRILRIKKTRTKIGTLRISHTSSKLHRDIPSGRLLTRFGDWVEHTSVAQVEVSGGLLLFVSGSC